MIAVLSRLGRLPHPHIPSPHWGGCQGKRPYGRFPAKDDPFHFIPCTDKTLPPALDDKHHERSWAKLYDPNPSHWSWGNKTTDASSTKPHPKKPKDKKPKDSYAGRGIYLCGYLDVPLDYTNKSDPRIARLAITKYQVSGLQHRKGKGKHGKGKHGKGQNQSAGSKSERTLVVEPGGPGGSGTNLVWRAAEDFTQRFSDGQMDVLGWDPRGVNTSLPSISCFPHDADRDRWAMLTSQYREVSYGRNHRSQLEVMDAMNDATFQACSNIHGDLPRFVSTAFVARDVEQIRLALGEDSLSGYFVSYGTGIGQTYANMFPDSVGRLILDGTEYVRDHRTIAGFGVTALDNATAAWRDGFLGECLHAGPEHCALAKPTDDKAPLTIDILDKRMHAMFDKILKRPLVGYTEGSGPSIITYSNVIGALYGSLYNPKSWPDMAKILSELEKGNTTMAAENLEKAWAFDPAHPSPKHASEELGSLVICADSYDAPRPESGLDWWESLWKNMTDTTWVSGNSRFFNVFPCQHFTNYWPEPAEVYRGSLNATLSTPVLLIGETYDPATPLRNGRRLLHEMGRNARLIAHHGYGHSSRDTSNCTEAIARAYIMNGTLPEEAETACYANEKPYLYGVKPKSN